MFIPKAPLLIMKPQPYIEVAALDMVRFWSERGIHLSCCPASASAETLTTLAQDKDLIIVLGGDGTLVSVARRLQTLSLPLLAFNFGRVGFLAEWMPDAWPQVFASLLDGDLFIQKHAGLSWSYIHDATVLQQGFAVNDVVLGRGRLARVVPFEIRFNDVLMGNVRSDGFIVSTPLGASGYSFSTGGALVHPTIDALCVTAIAPFQHSFSSMVLPPDVCVTLTLCEKFKDTDMDVFVTVDGQEGFPFGGYDRLTVRLMPKALHFVSSGSDSYIERLHQKNFIHVQ